jgi:DNA repair protein RadC
MATKKVVADHDFLIPEFKLTQVADINYEKLPIIRRSSDAVEVLSKYIAQKDLLTQISVNEFAFVLYLNKQNRVIGITNLSIGGLDSTLMDVRMVYSMAVKIGASSIIVAHNHPSQNLKPSEADIRMSNLMRDGGKSLTIQVLDFLIITSSSGYYSFGDEGMMAKGGVFAEGGQVLGEKGLEEYMFSGHYPIVLYHKNSKGKEIYGIFKLQAMPEKAFGELIYWLIPFGTFNKKTQRIDFITDKKDTWKFEHHWIPTELWLKADEINFDEWNFTKGQLEKYKTQNNRETENILDKSIAKLQARNSAKGGVFAKGGITEHGLKVGDTIVSEIDENTIVVENPTSGRRTINISTGHPMAKGGISDKIVLLVKDKKGNVVLRTTSTNKAADYCGLHGRENFTVETLDGRRIMAKGGRMGFKALSEKVASHYAGKSVPTKYQPEYGKFYDADEAKTVGNKVAAKVYRLQQGK